MSLAGLSRLNIELTSFCSKHTACHFCGHQDAVINPNLKFGQMDLSLLRLIRRQLDPGLTVAWHRDGDPVDHDQLGAALDVFAGDFLSVLLTHGERLAEKADEIINRCTVCCVSVYRGDPDAMIQYESLLAFLDKKGTRAPRVVIKIIGDMDSPNMWEELGLPVIRRLIHTPSGTAHYAHRAPTAPDHMTCLDFLQNPAVNWQGRVFQCVRLDVQDAGYLGDLREQTLEEIWNGEKRREWLRAHLEGRRGETNSLCKDCTFWGVPSEWQPPVKEEIDLIQLV